MKTVPLGKVIQRSGRKLAGDGDYPVLSMTMHEGLVDQADKFKKRIASEDTSQYRVVSRNQLVVGFPIDEGVLSFQDLYDEAIVSPAYTIWDVIDRRSFDNVYLERYLRSPSALRFYRTKLRSTTARRRVLPEDLFLNMPVPLLPLAEQRRIADILDRADALKRKRQQALQLAADFLGSIFDYHFGSPEKCSGYTSLGSLIDPDRPLTYGILMPGPDVPDGIPYIRVAEMKDGTVDLSDVKRTTRKIHLEYKRSILAEGDILISIRGHVGRVVVIPAELDGANITQDAARIALKDPAYREFVVGALLSTEAQRWMQKRVRGAAVKGLNLGDLRQLPIPIPSDSGLSAYTQAVRAIKTVRSRLTSATVEAEALCTSLANELLAIGGVKEQ